MQIFLMLFCRKLEFDEELFWNMIELWGLYNKRQLHSFLL